MDGYIRETDSMFFKHERSENLPCNTYSMHTHSVYELLYFIDGDATYVIEDRKYKLKKGDLILIRPMHFHFIQIDSPTNYERYDILFNSEKHRIESVALMPEGYEVINIASNPVAEDIFKRCDLYRESCDDKTFSQILPHLLSELFYNISIFHGAPKGDYATLSPIISAALTYINDNLSTLRSIGEIARKLFVTESYLFRLFKKELHQTPKKYLTEKRLLLAERMISSGEKPITVSELCGFHDYTTFYRNYTARFGRPPSLV